jgi:uncharacterized protein YaaR (DUF327 family)
MKIDRKKSNTSSRSGAKSKGGSASGRVRTGSSLFPGILGQETQIDSSHREVIAVERVQHLMEELNSLGSDLRLHLNEKSLKSYTGKLREILSVFSSKGFQTSTMISDGGLGSQHKQMQLMKKVDVALADLTKSVMNEEKDHIALASALDNIKGLLINYLR